MSQTNKTGNFRQRDHLMHRSSGLIAALIVFASATGTLADLRGVPDRPPLFTAEELALLETNPALADVAWTNPFLVRTLLDDLERANAADQEPGMLEQIDDAGKSLIEANPALDRGLRSSPEAALDLIKIIKEAAKKK